MAAPTAPMIPSFAPHAPFVSPKQVRADTFVQPTIAASFPTALPAAARAVQFQAPVPVQGAYPGGAPVAAAPVAPVAPVAAAKPKKPRAVKPKPTLADQLPEAFNTITFLKADGKPGPLKLTGAATNISKQPGMMYHGAARLFGSLDAINAALSDPLYIQALSVAGIDIAALTNPLWLVAAGTLRQLADDPNSWYNQEIAQVKLRQARPETTFDENIDAIREMYDAFRRPALRSIMKEDPRRAISLRLSQIALDPTKVLDVSDFNVKADGTIGGMKAARRPAHGGRSTRSPIQSLPVVSTNLQALKAFLAVAGYTDTQQKVFISEWVPPAVAPAAPAAPTA